MRPRGWFLGLMALTLMPAWVYGASEGSLADWAPRNTLVCIAIPSVEKCGQFALESPFAKIFQDPKLKPLVANLQEEWKAAAEKMEETLGLPRSRWKERFPGPWALFLSDLLVRNQGPQNFYQEINTGLITHFRGDREDFRRKLEEALFPDLPPDAERKREKVGQVPTYSTVFWQKPADLEKPADAPAHYGETQYHYEYALPGNYFFLFEGQRAYLKESLRYFQQWQEGRLRQGGLSSVPAFQAAMKAVNGDAPFWIYGDAKGLLHQLENFPEGHGPSWASPKAGWVDMLNWAALSLEETDSGYLAQCALAMDPEGSGKWARWIEAENNLSLLEAWTPPDGLSFLALQMELADIAREMSQVFMPLLFQPGGPLEKAGLDWERDVLAALGDSLACYQTAPTMLNAGEAEYDKNWVLLLSLSDGQKLQRHLYPALQALFEGAPLELEKNSFQGFHTYHLQPERANPAAPPSLSLHVGLTPDVLLFSQKRELVEQALHRRNQPTPKNLNDNPHYFSLKQQFQTGYKGWAWMDAQGILSRQAPWPPWLGRLFRGDRFLPDTVQYGRALAPYGGRGAAALYGETNQLRILIRVETSRHP